MNIVWSAGMPLSTIDLYLDYATNTSRTNVLKLTDSGSLIVSQMQSPSYSWQIPTTLVSHIYYAIRIQGVQNATQGGGTFIGYAYPLTIMNQGGKSINKYKQFNWDF